jgi:hypothetical protein
VVDLDESLVEIVVGCSPRLRCFFTRLSFERTSLYLNGSTTKPLRPMGFAAEVLISPRNSSRKLLEEFNSSQGAPRRSQRGPSRQAI